MHRSQRAPTAVHLGQITTRLHCGFRGSKDAPLTASAHGGADIGKTTTTLHCGFLGSKDAPDTASAHAGADLGKTTLDTLLIQFMAGPQRAQMFWHAD